MPQLDIGSLAPGEPAIVTNDSPNDVAAPPVAPQDNAPQQVHALTSTVTLATGTSVLTGESARTDSPSVETFASSSALESVSMTSSWSATTASSPPVISSTTTSSSLASSTIATSSLHPSSIPSRVALVTSSTSQTPSSSSSTVSASASTSSDAAPYTLTHGAPFYASLALGALILIACLAVVIAFLIRVRARRRDRAALTHIAWDPVVPGGGGEKDSTAGTRTLADLDLLGTDASLAGDRDVGEPKRAAGDAEASFITLSRRGSLAHAHPDAADENNFNSDAYSYSYADPHAGSGVGGAPLDAPYAYPQQQHPNPFVESAYYYAPHQAPPLADSAAYPLPPFPASASDTHHSVAPRLSFTSGPYPTARPLPAYLADRDPHAHRASVSTDMTTGTYQSAASTSWSERQRERQSRSAASSRSGSVRSAQLLSASTLRVANGGGSRASTALGMHHEEKEEEDTREGGGPEQAHEREKGFPALDTWRAPRPSESFAARAGWRPLQPHAHEQQQQQQGWGETLRASVLGAFHAVTGAASPLGASASTADTNAASGEDALTRAPTTGRARREAGWARFAQAERARSVSSARSIRTDASGGMGGMYMDLARPPALGLGLHPQYSANTNPFGSTTGSDADAASVRTDHSRAPLVDGRGGIRRPRPAVVSRVSQESGSVYSVGSAVPPQGYNGYGYGYGARAG